MADSKKYVSVLNYPKAGGGTEDLYIKDAEAREALGDLIEEVSNGFHFQGISETEITDGASTGPWTIDSVVFVPDNVTPSAGQVALSAGDIAAYGTEDFIWSETRHAWRKFGTTGRLGALAYKDSAKGKYTPAGTNSASEVSFAQGSGSDFVTGLNNDGESPSFSEGAFTPASLSSGFYTAGTAPSFTEGAFSAGSLPSFTEGAFSAGSLPSFTEGAFNAGTLPSMSYTEANEKLTFTPGTLPSKSADTFSAGALPSKSADTFSAGTLPSKQSDTFNAGTVPTIDVSKFDGGSKAADTFSAGSFPTAAKAKALTPSDKGTAAAQTFTGTEATITVS